jgi:hypothetical protein
MSFSKALTGKPLTRNEVGQLSPKHPLVDWYHPTNLRICFNCGEVIPDCKRNKHFQKAHILSLTYDDQFIHCDICKSDFPIPSGTFCGDLLGIEESEMPETVELTLKTAVPTGTVRDLAILGNSCWMNSSFTMGHHPNAYHRGNIRTRCCRHTGAGIFTHFS